MSPKRRLDEDLQAVIEDLAIRGRTAPAIERALVAKGVPKADRPSRRTLQRMVQAARVFDRSGPWGLGDAEGDEASLVLPVLRVFMNMGALQAERTERFDYLTRAEARWIVKLRRVAPELHEFNTYRLARAYLARETRGLPTHDLDAMLAFRPWDESPRRDSRGAEYTMREVYEKGVRGGTIPAAPPFLMNVLAGITWSPGSNEEWDIVIRSLYAHDPDAYEEAALFDGAVRESNDEQAG